MVKKVGDMELYNVKELAELLDFQETTVRKMLREGTLKGKKLGKKWFITDKAIQDYFIEEGKYKENNSINANWEHWMAWKEELIEELKSIKREKE